MCVGRIDRPNRLLETDRSYESSKRIGSWILWVLGPAELSDDTSLSEDSHFVHTHYDSVGKSPRLENMALQSGCRCLGFGTEAKIKRVANGPGGSFQNALVSIVFPKWIGDCVETRERLSKTLSRELFQERPSKAVCRRYRRSHPTTGDEVTYLGVFDGVGSHAPPAPLQITPQTERVVAVKATLFSSSSKERASYVSNLTRSTI